MGQLYNLMNSLSQVVPFALDTNFVNEIKAIEDHFIFLVALEEISL